jgi:hypothetical protein
MPSGGARKGAGRKPLGPENMVRITVMLPPELAAWVKEWPEGASYFVRGLIEAEYRRRHGPTRVSA